MATTNIQFGDVKIIHHSTSSQYQMIIQENGDYQDIWFDYYSVDDLIKAVEQLKINRL